MTDNSYAGQLADRLQDLAIANVETHTLILLDRQGIIVGWRGGAERMFGYPSDEVLGQDVSLLFTPEDREKGLSFWEQSAAAAISETEDDRWQVRKDGVHIWVSGTLTALRDEAGEVIGFAKVMRNRTDQKYIVESLERRIAALEQGTRRKNDFIATLAHEIRNPLGAISNALFLLEEVDVNETDLQFTIDIVKRQVDFLTRLADDLLEVARGATGKVELHKSQLVLQEVVEFAVETALPLIRTRGITLERILPEVPITIEADEVRLRQVFINLIQNAAKYSQPGGNVWVTTTVEGNEAVTRIKDNGVGIDPSEVPYIFELFTQAESAGQAGGGLGIGLSVVKEIVTLLGGTVQGVSDGLGKGSEFTVRIPLNQ